MRFGRKAWLFLGADDGLTAGGSSGASDEQTTDTQDASGDDGQGERRFTQAELDRVIANRLKRERAAWDKAQADKAHADAMSETERLKADRDAAEKRAADREAAADRRLVAAEARLIAAGLNVRPDRVGALLRLVDLSGVDVTDGEPDAGAIKSAVETAIKDFPEWRAGDGSTTTLGATNGARSNGGTMRITRSMLRDPAFYAKNKDAIRHAAANGLIVDE